MKKIKEVGLIGLGAIGGIVAEKLNQTETIDFSVLADGNRIDRYLNNPISINDIPLYLEYLAPENATPMDLILVAVKHHHLSATIETMKPFVGPNTILLSLMNGIVSEEILSQSFPTATILPAMIVKIDAVREAGNVRFSLPGIIHFGHENTDHPAIKLVSNLFKEAGIRYHVPEDLNRDMWWKFMINVGINQVSAILQAPYQLFQTEELPNTLVDAAMHEVIALAQAEGINLQAEDVMEWKKILMSLHPAMKTSMCQDMEAKRKTEVEAFAGVVIERAKKAGIKTPTNEMLFATIRSMELKNQMMAKSL
jgi:2-dehydropantoate 2-reductase